MGLSSSSASPSLGRHTARRLQRQAAEVKGEWLRQAPSPLYHHPLRLSQFCDKSVIQKWDPMGQLWLYLQSKLFIKKMASRAFSPLTILGAFSLLLSLSKTQNLENFKSVTLTPEVTVPDQSI